MEILNTTKKKYIYRTEKKKYTLVTDLWLLVTLWYLQALFAIGLYVHLWLISSDNSSGIFKRVLPLRLFFCWYVFLWLKPYGPFGTLKHFFPSSSLFHLAIVVHVLLWLTHTHWPWGIFKRFCFCFCFFLKHTKCVN